jgi:protein SCO1/2
LTTISRLRLGAALALLVAALASCERSPRFKSTDLTGADYGRVLELADHTGRARSLADFRGKVVIVFFGYAQCPDVCPTTLADLAQAMKRLGNDAERVQVLFVTLDPERDSAAVLAQYVPAFDPRFLGLRGDQEATRRAAKEFKVFYEKQPGRTPGEYTIDHSAQVYVIDTQGRLRLFVRHDRLTTDLVDDVRSLLRDSPQT